MNKNMRAAVTLKTIILAICIFIVSCVYYSNSLVCFVNSSIYNSDNVSTLAIVCIFAYLYKFIYEDLYRFCFNIQVGVLFIFLTFFEFSIVLILKL